jgi:hypothetical protein
MDIASPSEVLGTFYAGVSGVEAHSGYMSNRFDSAQKEKRFQSLRRAMKSGMAIAEDH